MSLIVVFALVTKAGANAPPVCSARPVAGTPVLGRWTEPLDRLVSFHVSDLSLREAIDRLAASAHIRVSYSSEALPLDRIVCVSLDSVLLGEVLAALLEGAAVEPIGVGGEHVVLAPTLLDLASQPVRPAVVLDRIVVTGSPAGSAWKPIPVALDVVDGQTLVGRNAGTLVESFNAAVPGMWMWEQSASSILARYGSIRGTSSFGLSYPKVYIDGIQVANPLLFTRIAPEAVDRIEVIRGPQGAALYGADAISGVANVVMRQETADAGAPHVRIRTGFGLSSSEWRNNPSLGQDHVLTLRAGSNTRSVGLNLEAGGTGAFIPGAYRRQYSGSGTARLVGPRTILTGTARFYSEGAGSPPSPLLPAALRSGTVTSPGQSVRQFTLGSNLKVAQGDRVTHTLVVGADGYSLDGVLADDRTPIPSAAEEALNSARGGADRTTLHYGSVARLGQSRVAEANVSFVAEHSFLYQWTDAQPGIGTGPGALPPVAATSVWRNNSGVSGQLSLGLADALFLTSGVRFERSSSNNNVATLPMLGASLVPHFGSASVKFRVAYGKGIRWPDTAVRETMWSHERSPLTLPLPASLEPEEQSGIEAGADFMLGQALKFQVTRFDQTASGLIQRVLVSVQQMQSRGPGEPPKVTVTSSYQMQNVGEISNTGWELAGTAHGGPLTLTGTLSFADSRVRALSRTYTGDLVLGKRTLDVPAVTMSGTATWSTLGWGTSLSVYRAQNWVGYDRALLVRQIQTLLAQGEQAGKSQAEINQYMGQFINGPKLRDYWMIYGGVTHVRATFTKALRRGFSFSVNGDNLLNRQRGEPDNLTVLPGRTFSLGITAEF